MKLLKDGERARVYRAATHIVKQFLKDDATAGNEMAAYRFLATRDRGAGLAPRCLGVDESARTLLLEDLGEGEAPDAALGTDLPLLGRTAGLFHAACRGGEAEFARARKSLPADGAWGRGPELGRWDVGLARFGEWIEAVGAANDAAVDSLTQAIAAVRRRYADPGDWLTLTHGDFAPTNHHVRPASGAEPRRVFLLDFEYAAYRHAYYDLTAFDVLCPLPLSVVDTARAAYDAAFRPRDDAEWACLVAYRQLALLSWVKPTILSEDRPWVGTYTARMAVLASLARTTARLAAAPELAPLRHALQTLRDRLAAAWPDQDGQGPQLKGMP